MKRISLLLLPLMLVGCMPDAPMSTKIIKFYSPNSKEVRMVGNYSGSPRSYNEYKCIDGDAIVITRKYVKNRIIDISNVGTNCVEINLANYVQVENNEKP